MLIAVDVGNTQTHVGMFRGDDLVEHWRFATVREATGDQIAVVMSGVLGLRGLSLGDVDGAIVSSVVPQLAHEYEYISERYLDGGLLVVGPNVKSGMPIRIERPHELGTDRLVNAVAAWAQNHTACVVVDFGTSTNYDIVSDQGEYLGGVISPGIEISMDALYARAAKLTKVDIEEPSDGVIGRSTQAAIQSGLVYGFAGQVDGILKRVRAELGADTKAIGTGGLAATIAPFCEELDEVDDLLTLTGLRILWERNTG
jgi:type III pantothenate kinase